MEAYTKEQVVELLQKLVDDINECNQMCCFDELDLLEFINRNIK